jgi:hypothetical protein
MHIYTSRFCATSKNGTRSGIGRNASLTKAPDKRRQWLRVSLHVPARDANQTRSLLSVARSLKESKSRPWTMTAQSESFSKTEPISDSMLSRSFASLPIFPIGKLTTTNASNAGHLCTANKPNPPKGGFSISRNPEAASDISCVWLLLFALIQANRFCTCEPAF